MENVKFDRSEEKGARVDLYFKIHNRLADFIREYTGYAEKQQNGRLDKENRFRYTIPPFNGFDELLVELVGTIKS